MTKDRGFKAQCSILFRNLTTKHLTLLVLAPIVPVFSIFALHYLVDSRIDLEVPVMVEVLSITLLINVTVLFSFDKDSLYRMSKKSHFGNKDNMFIVLINRYKVLIYFSFFYLLALWIYDIFGEALKALIVEYIFVYIFVLVIVFNVFLIHTYFVFLHDEIKQFKS